MGKRSMFVGMDVHKESIDVSLAEEGRDGEVRHYGVITGDVDAVAKVVRALRAPERRLRFVYEAGPCGFGIHRYLTAQGEDCVVVNPSSLPTRSGDRIKTDRRDGDALARLHRAGELTAIYIPTPESGSEPCTSRRVVPDPRSTKAMSYPLARRVLTSGGRSRFWAKDVVPTQTTTVTSVATNRFKLHLLNRWQYSASYPAAHHVRRLAFVDAPCRGTRPTI
jgi:transposase